MSEFERFRKTLAWFFALFPASQMTAATAEAWWPVFSNLDQDLVAAGFRAWVDKSESRFPPSASEMLGHVRAFAKTWRRDRQPQETNLLAEPEPETVLGDDHPVAVAMRESQRRHGQVRPQDVIRAIYQQWDARDAEPQKQATNEPQDRPYKAVHGLLPPFPGQDGTEP